MKTVYDRVVERINSIRNNLPKEDMDRALGIVKTKRIKSKNKEQQVLWEEKQEYQTKYNRGKRKT